MLQEHVQRVQTTAEEISRVVAQTHRRVILGLSREHALEVILIQVNLESVHQVVVQGKMAGQVVVQTLVLLSNRPVDQTGIQLCNYTSSELITLLVK